jgi:D-3-phosphoglycerate dehydrogenase
VPVAESVIGYLLSFIRRLPWLDVEMRKGVWNKSISRTLSECTLGVIGVGNVGKAVLRRARSFGMKLLGNDIIEIAPDFLSEYGVEMTNLQDLMSRADFISVNCTLNPTSFHLINEQTLSFCKPEAVIINTARGPIVKEPDLVKVLQGQKISGAALDVFEIEPLPADSPLLKLNNVLLAPHNSNSSPFYWERVHWNTIRNLLVGLEMDTAVLDRLR